MPCMLCGKRRIKPTRRYTSLGLIHIAHFSEGMCRKLMPGIYFKVLKEGQVQVDDKIEIIRKDKNNVTVKDIVHLYVNRDHAVDNIETMRRAIKINALPEGWKYEFKQNIEQVEHGSQNSYY